MNEPRRSHEEFFAKIPEVAVVFRHFKFGLITLGAGLVLFGAVVAAYKSKWPSLPESAWGAVLSVPVTVLSSGLFSVFYEVYMRTSLLRSMRALVHSWDSGVTVFPSHRDAPKRLAVLDSANTQVRLLSTTFARYFPDVGFKVREMAKAGFNFKFVVYDPFSAGLDEKAREEVQDPQFFRDEIRSTCQRYLGPLCCDYPERVKVRFCSFNAPFGITIVDRQRMVLSLSVYGQSRSRNETPCLMIENKYDPESVFKLYEAAFDDIWKRLEETSIPTALQPFFPPPAGTAVPRTS